MDLVAAALVILAGLGALALVLVMRFSRDAIELPSDEEVDAARKVMAGRTGARK